MKRFSSFLLALLMLVALLPAAGADDPVTLRILWWGSQTRHDLTMAAIEKFMEKNPDIKIEAEYTSWDGYWEKVATQIAGGVLPDVIQMDHAYLAQYSQAGVLEVLNPYFESGAIDISDVAQGVIDAGKCGGDEVYALSTGTNALVTMYRKDVLDQAGVVMPMEPTIEELAELSRKVYEATGHHNNNFNGFDGVRY
ncbi:MAG: extracellular solute-binding protein [Clostridia bacterium]|nr:extracellular solute-binding protein [Clostridia bacterium]